MAGTIVADTLTHSTAGSIATNYVVDGSAKSWLKMNGTGTIALADSLNVTSIGDNGTGDYVQNYVTSFSNANYSLTGGGGRQTDGEWRGISFGEETSSNTAVTSSSWNGSSVIQADVNLIATAIFGELA